MRKFATLSALAFVLATAGTFAQTPSTQQPAAGDKTAAPATKTVKKTVHHHKKGAAKTAATTPASTPAQK